MPSAAVASATASSAPGRMIESAPIGAVRTGADRAVPSSSVARSRSTTSRSIRGSIRQRSNAATFARAVDSPPALPAT